jgi:hypothetical protein
MGGEKPEPQPIVRGPAVQGRGEQERRESPDAGRAGARTVDAPGALGPGDDHPGLAPPDNPNKDTPPESP